MIEFRTTSSKLAENHQIQLERSLPSTKVSFKLTTSDEDQSKKNRIGSITAVTMRLINKLDVSDTHGLTKLGNKIYVLHNPSRFLISVYDDQYPFRLQAEIHIREIKIAADIAASEKSKCLYVTDSVNNCIWKIGADGHRVTRWLSDVGDPFTLSVNSDGHILNLRDGKQRCRLEIYGADANLIRLLPLSTDIQWPLHAVQKPNGQFIIMHKANAGCRGPWVISQLASDGKISSQYYMSGYDQFVDHPWHLSLDLEKDRLFLASCHIDGVILFDSTYHNWNKLRLTEEEPDYCTVQCGKCSRLLLMHYDTSKRELLIGHTDYHGLLIVEIS